MIEASIKYNKFFKVFCIKATDYVMRIMAGFIILNELEVKNTRSDFIYISGTKETKHFAYQQPFGIIFR